MKLNKKAACLSALSVLLGACSSPASQEASGNAGSGEQPESEEVEVYLNLDEYMQGIWIDAEQSESDPEEYTYYILTFLVEGEKMRMYQSSDDDSKLLDTIRYDAPIYMATWKMDSDSRLSIRITQTLTINDETGNAEYIDPDISYDLALTSDYRQAMTNPSDYYFIDFDEDMLTIFGDSYSKVTQNLIDQISD